MSVPPPIRPRDRETALVTQIAVCSSLLWFAYYLQRGDILLYGDAVAHINIARRIFDSRTPGLLQLGTVWLPLPHLLMVPFLLSDTAWQSGIGGSIPSMLAYVAGTAGIFRLLRGGLSFPDEPAPASRFAAWLGAGVFAANPNFIYMQSTAMTEPLYLALFIWSVVHFTEFVQSANAGKNSDPAGFSLRKCGLCLFGACLTRYDGWFLSAALCLTSAAIVVRAESLSVKLRRGLVQFGLLAVAAPALWLAYNAVVYRNPLEFANGSYSALAIEHRSPTLGSSHYPGWHNLPVAFSYFLKAAEDNLAEGKWQRIWVVVLAIGTASLLAGERKRWPLLLLWVPLPFYTLSIAYGSVPIFLPDWWPFSYYNVRFGLELLPACAVAMPLTVYFVIRYAHNSLGKASVILGSIVFVAASYTTVWNAEPICLREPMTNSRGRIALETELATNLKRLPQDATLLMYLGDHVGALQRAGIRLRRTINEGNHRPWKRPSDPEGLWEGALENPQQYADFVVALDDDPVAKAIGGKNLTSLTVIHAYGQPPATIYWTKRNTR